MKYIVMSIIKRLVKICSSVLLNITMVGHSSALTASQLKGQAYEDLVKQAAAAGLILRSPEAIAKLTQNVFQQIPAKSGVWIFGYGSLMWNSTLKTSATIPARVNGYQRCFCLQDVFGRGTTAQPGLMLGIIKGGQVEGKVMHIAANDVSEQLPIFIHHELTSTSYLPVWVDAYTPQGQVKALTVILDPKGPRYVAQMSLQDKAAMICRAKGRFGTNLDYLLNTHQQLIKLGIVDREVDALYQLVSQQ